MAPELYLGQFYASVMTAKQKQEHRENLRFSCNLHSDDYIL